MKTILLILAVVISIPLFFVFVEPRIRYSGYKRDAKEMISKLEIYRKQHGRYPDSLEAAGCSENPLYYRRDSDSSYILWFPTSFGESTKYDSTSQTWND